MAPSPKTTLESIKESGETDFKLCLNRAKATDIQELAALLLSQPARAVYFDGPLMIVDNSRIRQATWPQKSTSSLFVRIQVP
jgi:hypothetical protein